VYNYYLGGGGGDDMVKVKQSRHRPGVAQRFPGRYGS